MRLLFSCCLLLLLAGCKKDTKPPVYCWQLVDAMGNDLSQICDKTEVEIQALYPFCSYYKVEGPTYCWLFNGQNFVRNKSENAAQHLSTCLGLGSRVKVDCNYCKDFYHRIKSLYKPTGTAAYSPVHFERFCADTATRLFDGREILIRETTDSVITIQFSLDAIF